MPLTLPQPGPRKEAIISLTPRCVLAAEIGADHGIISAHLLQSGTCRHMIVADISAASLAKAGRLFARHDLSGRADLRVQDGLDGLDEPVEAIVIAGMGAGAMLRILDAGRERLGRAALILQPNLDHWAVRRWLMENEYALEAETLVQDGGRFYVVLRACRGAAEYTDRELLLGPCLLRAKPPLWREYLAWRKGCLDVMRGAQASQARRWVEEELRACDAQ